MQLRIFSDIYFYFLQTKRYIVIFLHWNCENKIQIIFQIKFYNSTKCNMQCTLFWCLSHFWGSNIYTFSLVFINSHRKSFDCFFFVGYIKILLKYLSFKTMLKQWFIWILFVNRKKLHCLHYLFFIIQV